MGGGLKLWGGRWSLRGSGGVWFRGLKVTASAFRSRSSAAAAAPPRIITPQAQPRDPENFPFIVLGNKIDEDEGRGRVVGGGGRRA
jgi:hypothetical protein